MLKPQAHQPDNDAESFELKRRLVACADQEGAVGKLGSILRDTNMRQIETTSYVLAQADRLVDSYGHLAVGALAANLHPPQATWFEVIFEKSGDRLGCLCNGSGRGSLQIYSAWAVAGEPVNVDPIVATRAETSWRPSLDWDALWRGTWQPSIGWQRRVSVWLSTHFESLPFEDANATGADFDATLQVLSLIMVLAIVDSPLFDQASLTAAA